MSCGDLQYTTGSQPDRPRPPRAALPSAPPVAISLTTMPLPPRGRSLPMFQPYRTAYRSAVTLALGPGPAASARWTTGAIPTLENALELAAPAVRARCLYWRIALHDDTLASPLDTADGHYEPVLARLSGSVPATIEDMSRAFTDMIAPLGSAPGTRNKAARNWRTCLTWAIGRDTAAKLLPMTSETLSAMLWDFTAMGASKSTATPR